MNLLLKILDYLKLGKKITIQIDSDKDGENALLIELNIKEALSELSKQ